MIEENPYSCEPHRASAWLSKEQAFPRAGLGTAIVPPYHHAPIWFIKCFHLSLPQIVPILQMRKLRLKWVKGHAREPTGIQ